MSEKDKLQLFGQVLSGIMANPELRGNDMEALVKYAHSVTLYAAKLIDPTPKLN